MAKTEMVCVSIDPELKREAEARIAELGMSVEEAVTMFYERLASICCDPFNPHIPNAETIAAMEEGYDRENLPVYVSFSEFLATLDEE